MSELKQYVRNNNGQRTGVVIAMKFDNRIGVGWSTCNRKDKWNEDLGLTIARGRAEFGQGPNVTIPRKIQPILKKMTERANKYFKISV